MQSECDLNIFSFLMKFIIVIIVQTEVFSHDSYSLRLFGWDFAEILFQLKEVCNIVIYHIIYRPLPLCQLEQAPIPPQSFVG